MTSIASLQNISVPPESGGNQALLMPKLQYRFRVLLEAFGSNSSAANNSSDITRQVVDVTRPNLTFDQITIDVYNSRTYLAGKHVWAPITLTLREDANNTVQKMVGQQLQRQFDFYEQSSAVSGGTYKFITKIEILDGGNGSIKTSANVLDSYNLLGCYIESANYNTLAYSSNDPVTVTLSIRYDNAVQLGANGAQNGGIGMLTPRAISTDTGGRIVTG